MRGVPAALGDALLNWRDRRLADPKFRRWAARFPLTRPVARRRARALFDLCAGFVYAQVLLACVQLDLFVTLAEGPADLPLLAARLGLPPDRATRLLAAAVSLRLAAKRAGGRFGLGSLGAALVENPGLTAMIRHHAMLYADLRDPVALLRARPAADATAAHSTALGRYWDYTADGDGAPDRTEAYTALMAASQPLVAEEVLAAVDLRRYRCLLDVGGGDGTFLSLAAHQAPDLRLMLADLPPVAAAARRRFTAEGLAARAQAFGLDVFAESLPAGADIASLVRVLHDHDDAQALCILRAVRAALPTGGTLLVAEPMAETPGAEPMGDAYFGFYLLAMGRGRPRTARALRALLARAGFPRVRLRPTATPLIARVLVAQAGEIAA